MVNVILFMYGLKQAPEDKENADSLAFGEKIKVFTPLKKQML